MLEKLEAIYDRYQNLEEQMSDPGIIVDMDRYKKVSKNYKDLKPIVEAFLIYRDMVGNRNSAKLALQDEDPEMREMAQEELESLNPQIDELEDKIKYLLIPKDPEDSRDVIFEIRSGTGGDEASLFAGDLYRMYTRYFEGKGWKVAAMEINEGSVGGYNKLVLEINGEDVFGILKFESGAHRVQRVPKTESQGRVHTSAATVVVMPKLEMEDLEIRKEDLRTDTFRSSGAGGQHVNKTESGVRFTHLPTGVVSESTDGRSQIQNREIALQRLYQKIYEMRRQAHESEQAAKRKSLVGSGDRSDKIRTYNFPQNRITDHRINLTLYNLDKVLEGDLDPIIEGLQMYENTEKLKAGEEIGIS
ncbi:peptide chain release factor 1 [Haliscomenobacter sp.]|jgi:peptide chain release factor 1|uniref:peptide chain release factor 1 n=1 Tax=Haliscomenobacter sp. TaxID=2717303 RepID=UPI003365201C